MGRSRWSPSGFSLLEVLISAFILSILSVGIVQGLTALEVESRLAESRLSAVLLATDLREEILSRPAVDPDDAPALGREPAEVEAGWPTRLALDDQDDYAGLIDKPAADVGGTPLAGMEKLWRSVEVVAVSAESPDGASVDSNPLRLRRFTVRVYKADRELAHLTWLSFGQGR